MEGKINGTDLHRSALIRQGTLLPAGRYTFRFVSFTQRMLPTSGRPYIEITLQITSTHTTYTGLRMLKNLLPEEVAAFARHFGITPKIGTDSPNIVLARCTNLEADLTIVHKVMPSGQTMAGIEL